MRGRLTACYIAIAIGRRASKVERPHQCPAVWPASTAEPSLHSFGPAVLVVQRSTIVTGSLPTSLRHIRFVRQALGLGPDTQAHRFPRGIVAVARPDQGVRDFVQKRIADEIPAVPLDKVAREEDGLGSIQATTHLPFAAVEGNRPVAQAVGGEQVQSQLTGLVRAGRAILCRR